MFTSGVVPVVQLINTSTQHVAKLVLEFHRVFVIPPDDPSEQSSPPRYFVGTIFDKGFKGRGPRYIFLATMATWFAWGLLGTTAWVEEYQGEHHFWMVLV